METFEQYVRRETGKPVNQIHPMELQLRRKVYNELVRQQRGRARPPRLESVPTRPNPAGAAKQSEEAKRWSDIFISIYSNRMLQWYGDAKRAVQTWKPKSQESKLNPIVAAAWPYVWGLIEGQLSQIPGWGIASYVFGQVLAHAKKQAATAREKKVATVRSLMEASISQTMMSPTSAAIKAKLEPAMKDTFVRASFWNAKYKGHERSVKDHEFLDAYLSGIVPLDAQKLRQQIHERLDKCFRTLLDEERRQREEARAKARLPGLLREGEIQRELKEHEQLPNQRIKQNGPRVVHQ